jgi:hypothetical protein
MEALHELRGLDKLVCPYPAMCCSGWPTKIPEAANRSLSSPPQRVDQNLNHGRSVHRSVDKRWKTQGAET